MLEMTKMQKQMINSSNLESVSYDLLSLTLEIQFHDNNIYQYYNVPEIIHNNLMHATSKGKYFDTFIKHVYRYRKIS